MAEAAYAPVEQTLAPVVGPTPEEIERRKLMAAALLKEAMGSEPIGHWSQGVSNIVQALMAGRMEKKAGEADAAAEAQAWQAIMGGLDAGIFGGGGGYGGGETADIPGAEPVAATGDDADMIIRTVIGEAAGEPPEGQQAVASVILNRARQAGMTPSQVVLAKGQFEPWGSRASQLRAIDPNSEQYRRVAAAVLPVLQGQASDPTGGATHFYAPKAQAALGRSTPSWARGQGRDIGNHRFYSLGYPGGGRHGTETADIPGAEPVGSAPSPDVMAHITGGGATPAAAPTPRGWNDAQPLPYSVGDELPRALTRQGPLPPAGAGTVPMPPARLPITGASAQGILDYPPQVSARPPDPRVPIAGATGSAAPSVTPAASVGAPSLYPQQGATSVDPRAMARSAARPSTVPPPPPPPPYDPLTSIRAPAAPAAVPPVHPLARVPQARPEPAVAAAPAAPAVTGSVTPVARPVPMPPVKNDYATVPGRRPSVAPVRPGQLMNEPYPGVMSAQEFARQGQAAMRARNAAGNAAGGNAAGGMAALPRRNLLQALLGRGGPQGQAGAPAAPVASGAPAGGAVAPVDGRRAQIASLLSNPRVPDALKLAALKSMSPQEREDYTLGNTRFRGTTDQPVASVPEKRESFEDAAGVRRYVDTQEPVFPSDVTGAGGGPMFSDKSVEGKSLNYLVETGVLTPQQAAEVGAGKSITGPNNEIIFMTPSGLVGTKPAAGDEATAAPGKVLTGPRKTEAQNRAAGFANRMGSSVNTIAEMEPAALSDWNQSVSQIPIVGNRLVNTEFQQFDQAQRDFINAQLRRESGAVISDAEFENARRQYLPIPGDDPKTLRQKAEARRRAVEDMQREAEAVPVFAEPEGEAVEVDENGVPAGFDPGVWNSMSKEKQEEYLRG